MKTPEKIYISPSIRTEIAYYSRILIGNPTFNICPRYGNEIEYVRADIHEAEIDVTQTALRLMNKTAEIMSKEIDALKAELAALKAPPKVLSAEDVEEEGWYWSVDNEEFVQIDCDPTILPWQLSMWRVSSSVCSRLQGQFIGPIQMPGV
ncbi:MAG: hypothetical protein JRN15_15100 [Nitrososphaerota archaeon]|nr:hypothetical protein [Nitrososphaerota archaeon]